MKRGKHRTSTESIREKEWWDWGGGVGGEESKFGVLLCDHAASCCQGHYGGGLILVC
jgi:hypothetical protein